LPDHQCDDEECCEQQQLAITCLRKCRNGQTRCTSNELEDGTFQCIELAKQICRKTVILMLRESALKKKHAELFHSNVTSSRITRSRSDLGLSGFLCVLSPASSQDVQSRHFHVEDVCQKDESAQSGSLSSPIHISKKEGTFDQKQTAPKDTDRSKDLLPIPKRREVFNVTASRERVTVEKPETLLTSSGSIVPESSSSSSSNLGQDSAHSSEKQRPLEKTPSNIRKMLSAFQSSPAQDEGPHIRVQITKTMPSKTAAKMTPKDEREHEKESNMALHSSARRIRSPFLTGEIQQHSDNPVHSIELSARIRSKYSKAIEKNVTGEEQKEEDSEDRRLHEHLCRKSVSEATTSSGYKVGKISEKGQCCFVSRHGWMFPDEAKHRCITMASKKVINLLEGFSAEAEIYRGTKIASQDEAIQEDGVQGNASILSENAEGSPKQQRLRPQSQEDDQTPPGPVEQAIKISIMVAFGILVLLTRQRKRRLILSFIKF
ncbi:hypothetical protein RJ641_026760, partial [Dillenia turbinata]